MTEEVENELKNDHGASDELINVLKVSEPPKTADTSQPPRDEPEHRTNVSKAEVKIRGPHSPRDPFAGSWKGYKLVSLNERTMMRNSWRFYVHNLHPELETSGPMRDYPKPMRGAGSFSALLEYDSVRLEYNHDVDLTSPSFCTTASERVYITERPSFFVPTLG